MDYDDTTESLVNGAPLPDHPSSTTARKITVYGPVFDADDNQQLTAGLHRNEISMLMSGEKILEHAYRYAIVDRKIYHTRSRVIIYVKTEPANEPV